jgi:hypothetical protein
MKWQSHALGGQDAVAILHGVVIGLPVFAVNASPIADGMTPEIVKPLFVGRRCQGSRGGDDLPEVEARTAGNENALGHDENSFGDGKEGAAFAARPQGVRPPCPGRSRRAWACRSGNPARHARPLRGLARGSAPLRGVRQRTGFDRAAFRGATEAVGTQGRPRFKIRRPAARRTKGVG